MKCLWKGFGAAVLALTMTANVHAVTFDSGTLQDWYVGAENNGFDFDVIGEVSDFSIFSSQVSSIQNTVTAVIGTNHVLDPDALGTRYGDLFLSNTYSRDGYDPSDNPDDPLLADDWFGVNDNMYNGTQFTHAVRLMDGDANDEGDGTRHANGNYVAGNGEDVHRVNSGTVELWSIDTANYTSAVRQSDDYFGTNPTHRNGQEVRVDTSHGGNSILSTIGSWTRDASAKTLTIEFDASVTTLVAANQLLSWHWGMTCGNDVVEDFAFTGAGLVAAPTPEPASLLVFGALTGLGLVGARRRRRTPETRTTS